MDSPSDLESLAISNTIGILMPLTLLSILNINVYNHTTKILKNGKHPHVHRTEWDCYKGFSATHLLYYVITTPGRELAFRQYED